MSSPSSPKDDQPQPRLPASLSPEEARQQARKQREAAADARAQNHQLSEQARRLGQEQREILQQHQARREHEAEQQALHTTGNPSPVSPVTLSPSLPSVNILLIEDNPAEVRLFHEALKTCEIPCQVSVLQNRVDVLAFVLQEALATRTPQPQLIIFDSIEPWIEIEEVIATVRSLPAYKNIPVILFSTLNESEGQRRSMQCGATAFVAKPNDLEATFAAIHAIVRRWGRPEDENQA